MILKEATVAAALLAPWAFFAEFLIALQAQLESPLSWWNLYQVMFVGIILGVLVLALTGYKTRDSSLLTDALLDAGMAVCVSLALTPFSLGAGSYFFGAKIGDDFFWTWPAVLGAAFLWMLIGIRIQKVLQALVEKYSSKGKDGE